MKTVLVTGANGQLGNCVRLRSSRCKDYSFIFTDVDTLDICDAGAVMSAMKDNHVDYVINCAAYTAVDRAEDEEDICLKINRDAVENLARAAAEVGARVIHVSTDYVFDGTSCRPYVETDEPHPVSAYGRTKLAGEKALLKWCPDAVIVRTAWLYSEFGHNFVKTMLRLGSDHDELRVVFDQVGSPTYAGDLADAILSILEKGEQTDGWKSGVYHFTDEGVCSWYDFTVKIMQLAKLPAKVLPIESKDYPAKAHRPHFSVLNKAKIKNSFGLVIPHWEQSLNCCLERLK